MRNLVLWFATLALGVAVGLFVRGQAATEPRADHAKPIVEDPVDRPRAATSDLARALEAIPTAERPQGDGQITGRVVDPDGKPLSGVRVSLQRSGDDMFETVFRVADAPDLETAVRQYVDWWRDQTTPDADATSGEDGRFVFEGLADHGYHVTGDLEGHDIGLRDSMFTPEVRPGGRVNLVAHPLVGVHLDVVLSDGSRPERASVLFSSLEAGSSQAEWVPAESVRRVVPGRYTVSAFVGETDAAHLESREMQITVKADGPPAEVVLRVLPGIYGTVEFASEGWHAQVAVHALGFEGDEPPSGTRLAEARRKGYCTHGSYRVSALEPGRYAVGVATRSDLLLARKAIKLAAGENRAQTTLPPLSVLTIRGLEPGVPILIYPDPQIRWKALARTAGENGNVVLDGLPPGRYVLKGKEGSMAVRVEGSMQVQFEPAAR